MKIEFPSMENYDLDKAGEMALYHAHSDLYPFKGVIETVENGLQVYREAFLEMANHAGEHNDFANQSKYMYKVEIYSLRTMPLAYYSLLITLGSILENSFNTLCRSYQLMNKYNITYQDIHGQGIERSILYLEKIAGIKEIKNDIKWEYIKTIRDARNRIVHNSGYIQKTEVDKFTKHGFYVNEEDNKLMFMYEDVINMYESTVEFVDRVFKIEPQL